VRIVTSLMIAASAFAAQLPPPPPPPPPSGQLPPRDRVERPEPAGTAVIRGRVVAADTGNPIRRANVNLSPAPPPITPLPPGTAPSTQTRTVTIDGVPRTFTSSVTLNVTNMARPRTATTDAQGGFEFTGLPAGSYRLYASTSQYAAAYLPIAFGATRPASPSMPSDPGTPIQLADGQRFEKATIALPRGAVIAGRVTDDNGDPMARVQVFTMVLAPGNPRPMRMGSGAQTDDLGQFRLFGLSTGDYLVAADARGPTFVAPNAPPETEDDKIGFITTYFPNTADDSSAQRVRARLGSETPGVEIRMLSGRLFRISGLVNDAQGRPVARASGSVMRVGSAGGFTSYGFTTDEQGRFSMRNIAPGNYRLLIRGRLQNVPQQPSNEPMELAVVPLSVNADLDGILVVTGPGAAITGQLIFENGVGQPPPGQGAMPMRVMATIADPQNNGPMPTPQPAMVRPDFTFTMNGILGEYLLRASVPGQFMKAVMLGAQDITDTPREFKNGERVSIVMTSVASTLTGIVSDAKGAPVPDAAILIFPEEKSSWRGNALRVRRGGSDQSGAFRVTGVLPGRYFAVALPRERMNGPSGSQDEAFFEQLSKDATAFVIGENEQRQVDLKIAVGSGG
jgi:hypothetical protein